MGIIRLILALWLSAGGVAQAGQRVALVIGNAGYNNAVGPLANPRKDAALVASALRQAGFEVMPVVEDAGRVALVRAVEGYARRLAAAGPDAVGFLYYSGHGAANEARNYLIPVDAPTAADDSLWIASVPLQDVIDTVHRFAPRAASIVVFDACRDALELPPSRSLGDGGKGLERVTAVPSMMIAFSTAPTRRAADTDRTATTGPYATVLAANLVRPGIDVRQLFDDVKFGVLERTGEKQVPWVEDGLTRRLVLVAALVIDTKGAASSNQSSDKGPARWGLTERDLSVLTGAQLLAKAAFGQRRDSIIAASASDDTAALMVALARYTGVGMVADEANAVDIFRRLAANGLPRAMSNLGAAYEEGKGGVAKDYRQAMQWYRRAAEAGNAKAMHNIGLFYDNGSGVAQDYAQAMQWYRRAADAGQRDAMWDLGYLYGLGHGVPQDYVQALQWFRRAADLELPVAMTSIGSLYQEGKGVELNQTQAMQWYRRGADAGDSGAMVRIGDLYRQGKGVVQDYQQAMQWYRRAADLSDDGGMFNVGLLYGNGLGVPQDFVQAMQWYRRASDLGNASGMEGVGFLYANGQGVEKDYVEAMKWYRRSADAGNNSAMYALGVLYHGGKGVPLDYKQAMAWYRRAADAGNTLAMANMGVLFGEGQGVTRDYAQAMTWYRRAADAGERGAMFNIGILYENGQGVTKDVEEAVRWYKRAAEKGSTNAAAALKRLGR